MFKLALAWLFAAACIANACSSSDDCTEGESHCEGSVIRICERHHTKIEDTLAWSTKEICGSPSLCVAPEGAPFCVISPTIVEACKDRGHACDGDATLTCRSGFITSRQDCGSDRTCVGVDLDVGCQPKPNPMCEGRENDPCVGNEAIYCSGGQIMSREDCSACRLVRWSVLDASTETSVVCGRAMNESCNNDGDCVKGLSCTAGTCTVSCTVNPAVSDFCQAVLGDPYHQTWFANSTSGPPIQTGSCQDGVCVWHS